MERWLVVFGLGSLNIGGEKKLNYETDRLLVWNFSSFLPKNRCENGRFWGKMPCQVCLRFHWKWLL